MIVGVAHGWAGGCAVSIVVQNLLYHVIFFFYNSLYRSSTRGPEDDSVELKYVAPLSHYMFNFTTVVFDRTSPPVMC